MSESIIAPKGAKRDQSEQINQAIMAMCEIAAVLENGRAEGLDDETLAQLEAAFEQMVLGVQIMRGDMKAKTIRSEPYLRGHTRITIERIDRAGPDPIAVIDAVEAELVLQLDRLRAEHTGMTLDEVQAARARNKERDE